MNTKGKILIIDDNEDVLFALNLLLEPYVEKIKVTTQPTRIEHFMTTFQPDVILLDMNFRRDAISGQEGFNCLEQILKLDPQAIVLFMTAYADTDKAVRAIKAGAIDFIPKPWEKEKLLATLSSAIKLRDSRKEVRQLKEQVVALSGQDEEMPQMIGHSAPMREVFDTIRKLSDTDANILILGENGTGKDLVARSLRYFSPRRECPFITIDLGSIPESLFESELFGYKAGAFTGAIKDKKGLFEIANHGTIFLDEIGEMAFDLQARLLRILETGEYIKLGDTKRTQVDVRIISATNRHLKEEIEKGEFREDLFFRLSVFQIHLPALRERKEDIESLARLFLQRCVAKFNKTIEDIDPDALLALRQAEWKGNVRELRNVIERSAVICDNRITREDLPIELQQNPYTRRDDKGDEFELAAIERKHILKVLQHTHGNKTETARLLKIGLATLYRKIESYHIQ